MNDLTIGNKDIVYSPFKMSKSGLEPIGIPSYDEWLKCGEFLKNANGAVHFWIGDWLNYGESKWGETYTQAIEETGYDYSTLSNDKWVSKRIDPSRRRQDLSFSHHKEVADLEPEDQDKMLDLAIDNQLNRNQFSKEVRKYRLKLDLPELSEQQLQGSNEDFEKITNIVVKLIEVGDDLKELELDNINEDAKDFLLSQVRKTFGIMASMIKEVN